ncbi:MAG TPA: hypothetical protein VGN18_14485 [Jatrophihabitans sp.]|jgi:hypothetical protein|uniref:beta strand repeat-containing protein n=1 Tax=Jatrophihabitans sp. TaxID=1932789 RepID=UPI002E0C63F8|nr:hypothetical protein [Jatrophihabitans sp.]
MTRPVRLALAVLAALALVAGASVSAFAYFSSSGSAGASVTTSTLNPPTAVTASTTAGTGVVPVSWTAPTSGVAPVGYYVTRSGSAACGSSASSLRTTTSCSDSSVPLGTYTYIVVAVFRSWTATSSPSAPVTVAQAAQAITFTSTPVAPTFGGTYTVTATGGASGQPVTFSSGATPVCTVSGPTVSFVGAGSCVVKADQAGSTYYAAAPPATQSFTVAKASQTITFTSTAPAASVGGASYTVTATGGASGSPIVFTIDATTSGKCSIAGTVVTFQHVGTCTVDANQAGNGNYAAANQVQQSFTIGQGAQAITFTSPVPSPATVGGASYTVTATGGASGNAVTFTSGSTSVCTLSGAVVSFIAVGTCLVRADQVGNADYLAAGRVQQSITVAQGSQTITFTSTAPTTPTVGTTYTPTATATSGLAVTFSISPTSSSVCSFSAPTVTFNATGSCVINANQAGGTNYSAAAQAQQSLTVVTPSKFLVSVPSPVTAGTNFSVTVTAADVDGNTVTGYTGSHTIAITSNAGPSPSGASPTLPTGTVTFTNGVGSVSVTLVKAESGRTLTATEGSITGTSAALTVTAGSASRLCITQNPLCSAGSAVSVAKGQTFTLTATLADSLGNPVNATATVSVTLSLTGQSSVTPTAGSISPGQSVSGTFGWSAPSGNGKTATITAAATGLASGTISLITG